MLAAGVGEARREGECEGEGFGRRCGLAVVAFVGALEGELGRTHDGRCEEGFDADCCCDICECARWSACAYTRYLGSKRNRKGNGAESKAETEKI